MGLRLVTEIEFDKVLEFKFIFVFSSLILDIDESSVTVERNAELISFLSGITI